MDKLIDNLYSSDPLLELVKEVDNFVGWIYSIDYDQALVITNDISKYRVNGIPHNCFLVAASFNPEQYSQAKEHEKEVILLRVMGSAKLPQDDQAVQTKINAFQRRREQYIDQSSDSDDTTLKKSDYDPITRSQLQFHGLKCRVLGTFFVKESQLYLGSDLETFLSATSFQVYRPKKSALERIVNHVDPIRRNKAIEDARELGITTPIPPFRLGTVRYTSTDRLHRQNTDLLVPFFIQPSDFLARRTAVLGMTRTGKSNMIKQMVAVTMNTARKNGVNIGQIIYDINGEYANVNQQDKGSIAEVFGDEETIRYSLLPKSDKFKDLRINFYKELTEGFSLLKSILSDSGRLTGDYLNYFVGMSLEEPDRQEKSPHNRWQVMAAAYRVLLYQAQFKLSNPYGKTIKFTVGAKVQALVDSVLNENLDGEDRVTLDPNTGLTLEEASEWFKAARKANRKRRCATFS
jgi:Helicase HerA, central domain